MAELSGATRVIFIAGDPIAQVKAPGGVTAGLRRRGLDAIVVPIHVAAADFADFVRAATRARNVDGLIATVPHKFAAAAACAGGTGRARSIGAVNVMRRDADGTWFGDMCDGAGFVEAVTRAGGPPAGRRALLVGAGGAGSRRTGARGSRSARPTRAVTTWCATPPRSACGPATPTRCRWSTWAPARSWATW
jgi:shikimate dehydrogenase